LTSEAIAASSAEVRGFEMDIVAAEKRSSMMRAVRQRNTRPELRLRKSLHAQGYRYRLHVTGLPGRPDLVFPSRRAVVFVHGCFWHGHDCRAGAPPATRPEYWLPKIAENRARDARKQAELEVLGWRVLTVWECELRQIDECVRRVGLFLLCVPNRTR
jgi:DNA mismatch endonuclease (patch repair protein)